MQTSLEERYELVKQAFNTFKPETVEIGPNTWKLELIKDKYYYVRGKDKIELDIVAELKVTQKIADDLIAKLKKKQQAKSNI